MSSQHAFVPITIYIVQPKFLSQQNMCKTFVICDQTNKWIASDATRFALDAKNNLNVIYMCAKDRTDCDLYVSIYMPSILGRLRFVYKKNTFAYEFKALQAVSCTCSRFIEFICSIACRAEQHLKTNIYNTILYVLYSTLNMQKQ